MVEGDPVMQRPYGLMVANPKRDPDANHQGASALASFLLKSSTQEFIATFGKEKEGDPPWFFPVAPEARD